MGEKQETFRRRHRYQQCPLNSTVESTLLDSDLPTQVPG